MELVGGAGARTEAELTGVGEVCAGSMSGQTVLKRWSMDPNANTLNRNLISNDLYFDFSKEFNSRQKKGNNSWQKSFSKAPKNSLS